MGNARQLRFVLASLCAAQLLTLATGANAKGQLAGSGGTVDVQDGDAALIRRVTNGREASFCETPPDLTQCESPTFAFTTCGDWWGDKIRAGEQTSCTSLCAEPTLADCQSSTYHLSLCGVVDARARQLQGNAPNLPNTDCLLGVGTCAQVLCEEFNRVGGSILGAAPVGSAVIPLSVNPGSGDATRDRLAIEANGWGDPQDIESMPLLEGSRTDFRAGGTGVHYWSRMLRDQARFLGAFGTLMPVEISNARAAFLTDRDVWDSSGITFNSCDEYVYEKYYDFSLFEDATRAAGTDFRKVFDVAYGPAGVPSSIGTRGINGTGFLMRDGTPLDVQLRFKQNAPRNVFHAFEDRVTAAERTEAIAAWESSNRTYTIDIGGEEIQLVTSRPLFQSSSTFINLIGGFPFVPMNASLHADLQIPGLHDESFQFHRDMSEELADFPDEVLFLYDRLKDEMLQLMERRRGIENDLFRLLGTFGDEGLGFLAVDERVFDPSIFENPAEALMTPYDDVIFQQRDAFERFDAEAGLVVDSMRILGGRTVRGESLLGEAAAGAQNRSGGGGGGVIQMADNTFAQSVGYMRDVAGTTSSSAGFPQRDSGSSVSVDGPRPEHSDPIIRTATRLLRELIAVDAEIEVLLLQAQSVGCVGEPEVLVTPCDWSPRDFAEAVEDQLLTEREQDHARCIGFTGDDFSALRIDEDVPGRFVATINAATDEDDRPDWGGAPCADSAYNTGTLQFERYPGCRDAWRRLVLWNISNLLDYLEDLLGDGKDLLDPTTGELRPNQQTGDGDSFGDSTFGASYSYNAGWEMTIGDEGDPEPFCESRPQMNASFSVTARIFGAEADIVDASIAAGLGNNATNRASLEVLGVSMIDVERTSEVPTAQFNVIFAEGASDYDEYFSASATFAVGPIPVTVSAGAGGIIAAGIEARGGDRPSGAGCEQGDLAIEGMFQPSYSLIGFASAGVDALVVEAGVKIDVLIVGLSFPFTTAIVFDGDMIEGQLDAKVTITNDLDMVFSILGGRMAAYVEVCFFICEEWDFTIFEWAPTRLSQNLFHSSIDFGLNALIRAQAHLPVPVVPGGM